MGHRQSHKGQEVMQACTGCASGRVTLRGRGLQRPETPLDTLSTLAKSPLSGTRKKDGRYPQASWGVRAEEWVTLSLAEVTQGLDHTD